VRHDEYNDVSVYREAHQIIFFTADVILVMIEDIPSQVWAYATYEKMNEKHAASRRIHRTNCTRDTQDTSAF
jgi:hypothetical protein